MFLELVRNKTLPENKGPLEKTAEIDLLQKLQKFALNVNADLNEPDGLGSVITTMLLAKGLLIMRDALNQTQFDLEQVRQQLAALQRSS